MGMRIAEIATLGRSVPPGGEGSVESLVSLLADGLAERGHQVTLFATADSRTRAALRSPVATSYASDPQKWDWQLYESFQVREAFRQWRDFDIIHCHSYYHGLQFCDFVPIPSLHSIHIEPGPDYRFLAERTQNRHLVFASSYQARNFGDLAKVHVIPHGIDMRHFGILNEPRGDYLAFLGRFIPEKGPMEAIAVARHAGVPLKMAAPRNEYYEQAIRPHTDGVAVEYVGELNGQEKVRFLAKAKALLYPVLRGEPFGLVLAEAMACGTPVLAFDRGAVREMVENGRTGFVGRTVEDLAQAAARLDQLNPEKIRRVAQANYSSETMIDRFEQLMTRIVQEGAA